MHTKWCTLSDLSLQLTFRYEMSFQTEVTICKFKKKVLLTSSIIRLSEKILNSVGKKVFMWALVIFNEGLISLIINPINFY